MRRILYQKAFQQFFEILKYCIKPLEMWHIDKYDGCFLSPKSKLNKKG